MCPVELAGRHAFSFEQYGPNRCYNCYRMFFDGSCADDAGGGGWVLYGGNTVCEDDPGDWIKLASLSFPLPRTATVTVAELESCLWGIVYFSAWLRGPLSAREQVRNRRVLDTTRLHILELAGLLPQ